MTNLRGILFVGVPLLYEIVNFDEVFQAYVKFFDCFVGFALLGKVLHELEASWMNGGDDTSESCGKDGLHKILF